MEMGPVRVSNWLRVDSTHEYVRVGIGCQHTCRYIYAILSNRAQDRPVAQRNTITMMMMMMMMIRLLMPCLLSLLVTLTFNLCPWNVFQQFPITWWTFVARFIDIRAVSKRSHHAKQVLTNGQPYGRLAGWTTRKHNACATCIIIAIFTNVGLSAKWYRIHALLLRSWVTFEAQCFRFTNSAFHPYGSVDEDQLRLGRKRQVWFIPLADERGVCR